MTTHESEMTTNHGATTTEELIVQYLDGELVRNELETVLFERLSQSEEARTLLREYLIVRGAIRMSREDERFQLSEDLDDRTRARIEQILESITEDEHTAGFLADRPAVQTVATTRRMKRWVLRPSIAALVLLLAVGTTWLVTHTTDERAANHQMAAAQPPATNVEPQATQPTTTEQPVTTTEAVSKTHNAHHAVAPSSHALPAMAQSTPAAEQKPATQPAQTTDQDDAMLSHRLTKVLNAEGKNEVVVSSRDRL